MLLWYRFYRVATVAIFGGIRGVYSVAVLPRGAKRGNQATTELPIDTSGRRRKLAAERCRIKNQAAKPPKHFVLAIHSRVGRAPLAEELCLFERGDGVRFGVQDIEQLGEVRDLEDLHRLGEMLQNLQLILSFLQRLCSGSNLPSMADDMNRTPESSRPTCDCRTLPARRR